MLIFELVCVSTTNRVQDGFVWFDLTVNDVACRDNLDLTWFINHLCHSRWLPILVVVVLYGHTCRWYSTTCLLLCTSDGVNNLLISKIIISGQSRKLYFSIFFRFDFKLCVKIREQIDRPKAIQKLGQNYFHFESTVESAD
jgi:hypothetical protein